MRRTSLRSCIRGSVLIYTVGLAPKWQKREARDDPPSYYHGHIGAISPLAGGHIGAISPLAGGHIGAISPLAGGHTRALNPLGGH
jgi:hypothetical protein